MLLLSSDATIMTLSREIIETEIRRLLTESFEIQPGDILPGANLFDDLGLDSLDAIDMLLSMETYVGRRLNDDDKDRAKQIRTLDDLVTFVEGLASRDPAS